MDIENYILNHIDAEDEYLHRLWRELNLRTLHGRMSCGWLQGCVLQMFVRMTGAKKVLEVGTFGGYSAICLARGLAEGGRVWTFDINDEMEDFARHWIEGSDVGDRILFNIGDAIREAPRLGVAFDLVYLDGDKRTYVEAYEMALQVTRPGGFILADNTLWDGHVDDAAYDHDAQTLGVRRLNDLVAGDKRVEKVILPIRDGLTILYKMEN